MTCQVAGFITHARFLYSEWSEGAVEIKVIFLGDLAFLCYMPGWLSWQGQPDLLLSIV